MSRILAIALTALSLAIGSPAVAAQDASPAPSDSLLATHGYPELRIEVAGVNYELPPPELVPAGRYLVTLANAGEESWHGFLLRLPEGVTIDSVMSATPTAEDAPPAWLFEATYPGFPGETQPGQTNYAVVDLVPGEYLIVGDSFQPFVVTSGDATPSAAAPPDVAASVGLFEYGFDLPESITPGRQIWEMTNTGSEPHEFLLGWSPSPITREQLMELVESEFQDATPTGGGPSGRDLLGIGGMGWLTPGATAWTEVDLQPGTYFALCYVFDPETGQPHVANGMLDVFTVGEAATPTP